MRSTTRNTHQYVLAAKAPLDCYGPNAKQMLIYENRFSTLYTAQCFEPYSHVTLMFPLPPGIHDITTFQYVVEQVIFTPNYRRLNGAHANLLLDNLLNFGVEIRPMVMNLHLNIIGAALPAIEDILASLLATVFVNQESTELNSQQLRAFQDSVWTFNEQQKKYDRLVKPQEYRSVDIQEQVRVLISEAFAFLRNKRFQAVATSHSQEFLATVKNSLESCGQRILATIEFAQIWKADYTPIIQQFAQQIVTCAKRPQNGQENYICDVSVILHISDIFQGFLENDAFELFAAWLQHENGPIRSYLRYQNMPELLGGSMISQILQIEKYLFLYISFEQIPQEFSDVVIVFLESLVKNPVDVLRNRGLGAFQIISYENLAAYSNVPSFHIQIVRDVMQVGFDNQEQLQGQLDPVRIYGQFSNLLYSRIARMIDFWSVCTDKNALQQYLGVPQNRSVLASVRIEVPERDLQCDGWALDVFYKRHLFPILLSLGRRARSAALIALAIDRFELLQILLPKIASKSVQLSILSGNKFTPQNAILRIVSAHKRVKTSLADETVEMFKQRNVAVDYFAVLRDFYPLGALDNLQLKIKDYPKVQATYAVSTGLRADGETEFQKTLSGAASDAQQISNDGRHEATLERVSKAIYELPRLYQRTETHESLQRLKLEKDAINPLEELLIDWHALQPRDSENLVVSYFKTRQLPLFDAKSAFTKTQQGTVPLDNVGVKLTIVFDTSFVVDDLQYVLAIVTYLMNKRCTNAKFDYYNAQISVTMESQTVQLFVDSLSQLPDALHKQFAADDFAIINREPAFLGAAQMLQAVTFAGSKVDYQLHLRCYNSYVNTPDSKNKELFSLGMQMHIKQNVQLIIEAIKSFDLRLRKLYEPRKHVVQRRSYIIRNSSEQSLIRTNVVLFSDLSFYHASILQAFYRVVFAFDNNVGGFRQHQNNALQYVLNEARASALTCQNFLRFLPIQGLENSIDAKCQFAVFSNVLFEYQFLYAFRGIEDLIAVLKQCPLNVDSMETAVIVPDAESDRSLECIVNKAFLFGVAHEFNVTLAWIPRIFSVSDINNSIVPDRAAKLISQLQNLLFQGIKLLQERSIRALRSKVEQLQNAKADTQKLMNQYSEALSSSKKTLFGQQKSAIKLEQLQKQSKTAHEREQHIQVEFSVSREFPAQEIENMPVSDINAVACHDKQNEILARLLDTFSIRGSCINGVPFAQKITAETAVRRVGKQSTVNVDVVAKAVSPRVLALLQSEFFAQETAEFYVCLILQWVARIFQLRLRHGFAFPQFILFQNVPKCAVPVALPLLQNWQETLEMSGIRQLHPSSLSSLLHARPFGAVLPLSRDYLTYYQHNQAISTFLSENIAFIATQIGCDLCGYTDMLDALQRCLECLAGPRTSK